MKEKMSKKRKQCKKKAAEILLHKHIMLITINGANILKKDVHNVTVYQ